MAKLIEFENHFFVSTNKDSELQEASYHIPEGFHAEIEGNRVIIKRGKQRPIDKLEPKFKAGDWASTTQPEHTSPVQIVDKDNVDYRIEDTNGNSGVPSIEWFDKVYHPWTIKDAKDGDVLVCDGKYGQEIGIIKEYVGKYGGCDKCFETYCFVDWEGCFRVGEYMGSKAINPATKKQRDILKRAMTNNGYKWDAEKKQVIKL